VADFADFGAMLVSAAGTHKLAARITGNTAYRAVVGVVLTAAFILFWICPFNEGFELLSLLYH
jgi:hypothetical protein